MMDNKPDKKISKLDAKGKASRKKSEDGVSISGSSTFFTDTSSSSGFGGRSSHSSRPPVYSSGVSRKEMNNYDNSPIFSGSSETMSYFNLTPKSDSRLFLEKYLWLPAQCWWTKIIACIFHTMMQILKRRFLIFFLPFFFRIVVGSTSKNQKINIQWQ